MAEIPRDRGANNVATAPVSRMVSPFSRPAKANDTEILVFAVVTALAILVSAPLSAQAGDRTEGSRRDPGKVACRKSVETGSILRQRILCKTQGSWNSSGAQRRIEDDYSNEAALQVDQPAPDQSIAIGTMVWDKLPALKLRGRLPYAQLVLSVQNMLKKGQCKIAGQTDKAFDIDVRFAVRVAPGGRATQVVVSDTGCATLNTLVGLTLFARSKRGDIEPEATGARWFAGAMNFTLR